MTRILGIDPGSRLTGYGIIEMQRGRPCWVASGCIRMAAEPLPERLRTIFQGISTLLDEYLPTEVAIESVFMHRNPDSALKLGQARGAAITAVTMQDIVVSEYAPSEIKRAVVGRGNASKQQVQHMVTTLLALSATPQADAADALAVAVCHGHNNFGLGALQQGTGRMARRRGRFR